MYFKYIEILKCKGGTYIWPNSGGGGPQIWPNVTWEMPTFNLHEIQIIDPTPPVRISGWSLITTHHATR